MNYLNRYGKSQDSLDQPQMMVVPDVEDAFVPMQEDFFVDPTDSRHSSSRGDLIWQSPN